MFYLYSVKTDKRVLHLKIVHGLLSQKSLWHNNTIFTDKILLLCISRHNQYSVILIHANAFTLMSIIIVTIYFIYTQ